MGEKGRYSRAGIPNEAAGHCLMDFIESGGLDFINLYRPGRYNSPEQSSTFYTVADLGDCRRVVWVLS